MPADARWFTIRQRWEEARRRGRTPSAEELCRDCPDLLAVVRQQLPFWLRDTTHDRPTQGPQAANDGKSQGAPASRTVRNVAPVVLQAGMEPVPGYRLIQLLGQGSFGEVWKATGPGNVPVALKLIRLPSGAVRLEVRALKLMKQLRHPHLLTVSAYWKTDALLIIAVDLADGTLLDRLRACQRHGLPGVPGTELLAYLREAAKGIDYLNEPRHSVDGKAGVGVTHRDIKPANLLLVGGSVKVGDFGLAKLLEHTATRNTGNAMTVAYAPPEFLQGRVHRNSDQYSLAVTYCELRCGRLPFQGDAAQLMFAHLKQPPDLTLLPEAERPAVARALAKNAQGRWPSCRAFVAALATAGQKAEVPWRGRPEIATAVPARTAPLAQTVREPQNPRPAQAVREPLNPRRHHRWLAGAAIVLALAGLSLLWLIFGGNAEPQKRGLAADQKDPARLAEKSAVIQPESKDPAVEVGTADLPKRFENSIGMKLVLIPKGKFTMGSPANEEGRREGEDAHEVEITKPFYMGVYDVTQAQYRKVMGENPSYFSSTGDGKTSVEGQDTSNFPVETVCWHDGVAFCMKLSTLTEEKHAKRTYRLPTEAEWEYACRGGRSSPFHFGNAITSAKANFLGSNLKRTTAVGSYPANDFGLYDMHGNVWEWCADWYTTDYYKQTPRKDPQGPQTGARRVLRGGSWYSEAGGCRAAIRYDYDPDRSTYNVGFRVVCVVGDRIP
jgi:formylglycine-generating enzyme required for sulfatase activity/serine/threonine protein kinase